MNEYGWIIKVSAMFYSPVVFLINVDLFTPVLLSYLVLFYPIVSSWRFNCFTTCYQVMMMNVMQEYSSECSLVPWI